MRRVKERKLFKNYKGESHRETEHPREDRILITGNTDIRITDYYKVKP